MPKVSYIKEIRVINGKKFYRKKRISLILDKNKCIGILNKKIKKCNWKPIYFKILIYCNKFTLPKYSERDDPYKNIKDEYDKYYWMGILEKPKKFYYKNVIDKQDRRGNYDDVLKACGQLVRKKLLNKVTKNWFRLSKQGVWLIRSNPKYFEIKPFNRKAKWKLQE